MKKTMRSMRFRSGTVVQRTLILLVSLLIVFHAASSACALSLQWTRPTTYTDGSPLANIGGYKVYYGTRSKHYTSVIDAGNVNTFSMPVLMPGVYYLAVSVYDAYGIESSLSNEVVKTEGNGIPSFSLAFFYQGDWYVDYNNNGVFDGCGAPQDPTKDLCMPFGQPGDIPVTSDWNGDGLSKLGVFRSGDWYIDYNNNGKWDGCSSPGVPNPDLCMPLGQPGDIPVTGDWNGDGRSKLGFFRNGDWYIDYNNNGVWDGCSATPGVPGPDVCMPLGQPGDIPVTGDWNGDGRSKVGVFRNGDWYLDYNDNGMWDGCSVTPGVPGPDVCMPLGQPGDIPVTGDWNNDGRSKVGVFRNGYWYLDYNGNGSWNGDFVDLGRLSFGLGYPGARPFILMK